MVENSGTKMAVAAVGLAAVPTLAVGGLDGIVAVPEALEHAVIATNAIVGAGVAGVAVGGVGLVAGLSLGGIASFATNGLYTVKDVEDTAEVGALMGTSAGAVVGGAVGFAATPVMMEFANNLSSYMAQGAMYVNETAGPFLQSMQNLLY